MFCFTDRTEDTNMFLEKCRGLWCRYKWGS